jgi:hypothetical protein
MNSGIYIIAIMERTRMCLNYKALTKDFQLKFLKWKRRKCRPPNDTYNRLCPSTLRYEISQSKVDLGLTQTKRLQTLHFE